jgi:hypothetical protein
MKKTKRKSKIIFTPSVKIFNFESGHATYEFTIKNSDIIKIIENVKDGRSGGEIYPCQITPLWILLDEILEENISENFTNFLKLHIDKEVKNISKKGYGYGVIGSIGGKWMSRNDIYEPAYKNPNDERIYDGTPRYCFLC